MSQTDDSNDDSGHLKHLQVELSRAEQRLRNTKQNQLEEKRRRDATIKAHEDLLAARSRDVREAEATLRELNAKRNALIREGPPVVTEHAVLRYLTRIKGLDLDSIKAEILGDSEHIVKTLGGGEIPVNARGTIPATHRIVVKNGVVVTVTHVNSKEDDPDLQ